MEETAKERAARRWRESQAPTEVPKVEPASVAPLGCKEAGASGWFAASAFDTSARAVADAQYVFTGAFVAHHYLRDAMRRADRTAAAASVRARPLRSDDDDIDKAWSFLTDTPRPEPLAAQLHTWCTLSRAALAQKVAEGRCFIAEARPHTEAPQSVFAPAAAELAVSSCCAVFVAFDTDEAKGEGEVLRHYTCRALPSLDIGGLAAVLLAFAQECAPAQDAGGRPLGCHRRGALQRRGPRRRGRGGSRCRATDGEGPDRLQLCPRHRAASACVSRAVNLLIGAVFCQK